MWICFLPSNFALIRQHDAEIAEKRFSRWRPSAFLDCEVLISGHLKLSELKFASTCQMGMVRVMVYGLGLRLRSGSRRRIASGESAHLASTVFGRRLSVGLADEHGAVLATAAWNYSLSSVRITDKAESVKLGFVDSAYGPDTKSKVHEIMMMIVFVCF